ncbi:hypothetical protein [Streptomyces glaucescens]|uniref:Uncharacterized protein n=1 Tax=Streptomyces glaucescens TaxID=1907 RepID=A0A089WYV6_STRGA|nr:hypothetical protein [Streptomyces glaucescens]AIR96657.1 hypothetical protein SGLAU_03145 [Streptomyces glaucescens]
MGKDTTGPAAGAVDEELIREVARDVIERAAPGELAVFRRRSRAYFRDPDGELKAARRSLDGKARDELLGSGAGEVIVVVAPFVLAIVQGVLTSLAQDLAASAVDRSQEAVRRLLRRVLRRPGPTADGTPAVAPEPPPAPAPGPAPEESSGGVDADPAGEQQALTEEQLRAIHRTARATALDHGLPEDRARSVADALVDALRG